jgi:hypothetical protein
MIARRSTSDPVSPYLATGERVVWRHQPEPGILMRNRLPTVIIVLLMTAFLVVIGVNVVRSAMGPLPTQLDAWLILPAAAGLFFLVLLYFFLTAIWSHARFLLDSWSTHYALTDRRFLVVSNRGVVEYDASYFRKMEPLGGAPGAQVLAFDWGPSRKRRENYRDRIAGLPDAAKLERLIRDTLRA